VVEIPDLTYFIGRPFDRLDQGDAGEWTIVLDGDALITNKDPAVALPDEDSLKGTQFIRPIFSETDTRIQFGTPDAVSYEITLNPMQYTINSPEITGEEPLYPQVPAPDSLPPDPSDDRVPDGPVGGVQQEEGE